MNHFFSIIIPTLNEEKYLPKLLSDFTKQKEKNFEIIIADGQSTDKTKEMALNFRDNLPIIFLESKKKNVASQRNYGALQAQGDYLIFIDADSRTQPSFTKKAAKFINDKKGLIFVPYFMPEEKFKDYRPIFDLLNVLAEFSQNLKRRFSLGGTIIVEKDFFNLIKGFNEKLFLSEDHELIQRAYQWGVNTKFMSDVKTVFCLRRMKKEGQLKYFYKYFTAATHHLFTGEMKKKLFDYKMGGQFYEEIKNQQPEKSLDINLYIKKIKKLFENLLRD